MSDQTLPVATERSSLAAGHEGVAAALRSYAVVSESLDHENSVSLEHTGILMSTFPRT